MRADGYSERPGQVSGEVRARASAVTIRMSEEEIEMLRAVAEAKGLSISDTVRQHVRREHEKLTKNQTSERGKRSK
jgi:hypothetical protein